MYRQRANALLVAENTATIGALEPLVMMTRAGGMNRFCLAMAAVLLCYGCAGKHSARVNLNSTAWMQTSEEYRALSLGAYNVARRSLDEALEDPGWTALPSQVPANSTEAAALARLPTAIILDIDETVLGNLPYQAWLVKNELSFTPASWNAWVSESSAEPLPGALEFVQYAKRKGTTIFYLSNRAYRGPLDRNADGQIDPGEEQVELKSYTIANLVRWGFLPQSSISNEDSVIMRGETDKSGQVRPGWALSDKTARRESLSSAYRIVLIMGDDLNDFMAHPTHQSAPSPGGAPTEHRARWGRSWIMLPNPIYGSWERRLYRSGHDLSAQEAVKMKLDRLDAWQ
jgi:predicted secreted acid phosphatase